MVGGNWTLLLEPRTLGDAKFDHDALLRLFRYLRLDQPGYDLHIRIGWGRDKSEDIRCADRHIRFRYGLGKFFSR